MGDFITRGGAKYPDTTPPPQWVCDVVPQEELARTKQHSIKRHTMETDPSAAAQRGGKYHIPGYCGYIPNRKDVAGRTFARETRRALNHDAKDIVIGKRKHEIKLFIPLLFIVWFVFILERNDSMSTG